MAPSMAPRDEPTPFLRTRKARLPLRDITSNISNVQTTSSQIDAHLSSLLCSSIQSSSNVPGPLKTKLPPPETPVRNQVSPFSSPRDDTPTNNRVSALSSAEHSDRRDSQLSTTSTNDSTCTGRPLKKQIGPWRLGRTLGRGMTGRVRFARHSVTGQPAAIKIVSKQTVLVQRSESVLNVDRALEAQMSINDDRRQAQIPFALQREIAILKLIEHPNLVTLYDVWENRGELYIVQEFVEGGELFQYIFRNAALPEQEAVRIFRQILAGLSYCHQFQVCHRDIKPENIMLDVHGNVKICDFGMASLQQGWLTTRCGSPHYLAPEIVCGTRYRGEAADIWAAGTVLFVMLTGRLPFGSRRPEDLDFVMREIRGGKLDLRNDLSVEAEDLILRLFEPHSELRIPISEIWQHPLLLKYEHLARRPSLAHKWLGGPPPALQPSDCGQIIRNRNHLDMDVIHTLCVLWHRTDLEDMVRTIMSEQPNYQRVMYRNLLQFRFEAEESYAGQMTAISASDHHRLGKPKLVKSATRASLLGPSSRTLHSSFSIVASPTTTSFKTRPKSLQGSPSLSATERSYDPYRASRYQTTNPIATEARITVLRQPGQGSSTVSQAPSHHLSLRHPAVSRLLQEEGSAAPRASPFAIPSTEALVPDKANSRRSRNSMPRAISQTSYCSSVRSSASGQHYRRSAGYHRSVSFDHRARRSLSSTCSTLPARPSAPTPTLMQKHARTYSRPTSAAEWQTIQSGMTEATGSPSLPDEFLMRVLSRKEGHKRGSRLSALLTPHSQRSSLWEDAARQVSVELSRACDEAFNQEAIPSQAKGLPAARRTAYHEASSSESESEASQVPESELHDYRNRPLPEPPVQEPMTSHTHRELAKAQEKLRERAKLVGPGRLDDIIDHIERLMHENWTPTGRETRITSAPSTTTSPLRDNDDSRRTRQLSSPAWLKGPAKPSIRVVGEGWRPEPLTIRKKTHGPAEAAQDKTSIVKNQVDRQRRLAESSVANITPHDYLIARNKDAPQLELTLDWMSQQQSNRPDTPASLLAPILEDTDKENCDPDDRTGHRNSAETKLKQWLRRSTGGLSGHSHEGEHRSKSPLWHSKQTHTVVPTVRASLSDDAASDFPFRSQNAERLKAVSTNRFLRLLGLNERQNRNKSTLTILGPGQASASHDDDSIFDDSLSCAGTMTSHHSSVAGRSRRLHGHGHGARGVQAATQTSSGVQTRDHAPHLKQQSWLARLLHIRVRAARRVLPLALPRMESYRILRGILREWRRYGARVLARDQQAGWIRVGVTADNALGARPVVVRLDVFGLAPTASLQRNETVNSASAASSNATVRRQSRASIPADGNDNDKIKRRSRLQSRRKSRRAIPSAPAHTHTHEHSYSLVRLTQEEGARSSFERLVSALRAVLKRQDLLVSDSAVVRDMRRCLRLWEQTEALN